MKTRKIRIIAYCGMISLLVSLIVGLFGFSISTKNISDMKNQLLRKQVETNLNLTINYINIYYGRLSLGDGTLLDSNGNSIEAHLDEVDSVLKDIGYKSTIFVKVNDDFKRILTNIKADENQLILGTYLGPDHNAYESLINGELYVEEAVIQGEHYYTAYQPIKDEDGNLIGALSIGTPTREFDRIVEENKKKMNKINILIIGLRGVSLASLIALVSLSIENKKNISR